MYFSKAAAIFLLTSALLAGCTVGQPAETTVETINEVKPQSFTAQNIQARLTSFEEDGHPYKGVQYDITALVQHVPAEQLHELEIGLHYTGKTAEILGVNESGYTKGCILLENGPTSQKIVSNASVLRSPAMSEQDLNYLLSDEAISDITIRVHNKEGLRIH